MGWAFLGLAAVGAGEIDLAMLIDRWPEEFARRAELEYKHACWTEGRQRPFGID